EEAAIFFFCFRSDFHEGEYLIVSLCEAWWLGFCAATFCGCSSDDHVLERISAPICDSIRGLGDQGVCPCTKTGGCGGELGSSLHRIVDGRFPAVGFLGNIILVVQRCLDAFLQAPIRYSVECTGPAEIHSCVGALGISCIFSLVLQYSFHSGARELLARDLVGVHERE